jgi:hypothetical protein
MRTATIHCELPRYVQPSPNQAVKFKDGMIVKAEDLEAAARYPLAVFQTLVRAYFGCGIVCGLEWEIIKDPPTPAGTGGTTGYTPPRSDVEAAGGAAGGATAPAQAQAEPAGFMLCIKPGVALGCDGYPIELCETVKFNLRPDPCCPDFPPPTFCVAIRRCTSDDVPRSECGCEHENCGCRKSASAPRYHCSRVKEHVILEVFKGEGPKDMCMRPHDAKPAQPADPKDVCGCLRACSKCDGCGESWVLLGDFTYTAAGGIKPDPRSRHKLVKPTQCICDALPKKDPGTGRPPVQ